MSFDPIVEGSAASPGLWNRRFQSIWSSLDTLSSSSGTIPLFSGVTAVKDQTTWPYYWGVESGLSMVYGQVGFLSVVSRGVTWDLARASSGFTELRLTLPLQGNFAVQGASYVNMRYDGSINVGAGYAVSGATVVGTQKTGWTSVPTGTPIRTTFVTSTATLGDVAQRLAALIIDLTAHGLIGP